MKNQLMRIKKSEGFISIETVLIAGIMVIAGIVAFNVLYSGTLATKVGAASNVLELKTPTASDVFDMVVNV